MNLNEYICTFIRIQIILKSVLKHHFCSYIYTVLYTYVYGMDYSGVFLSDNTMVKIPKP